MCGISQNIMYNELLENTGFEFDCSIASGYQVRVEGNQKLV